MISCAEIQEAVNRSPLVRACDVLTPQSIRMMTPFLYPDGSNIDLFALEQSEEAGQLMITDYGQTRSWLNDLGIDINSNRNRKRMAEHACELLNLEYDGWQIKSSVVSLEVVPDTLFRVAQACVRLSDLMFTKRRQLASPFKDEVEEFFTDLSVVFEGTSSLVGASGASVQVDFVVRGPHQESLVLLIPRYSHATANEMFVRWYELRASDAQKLTILNDDLATVRSDDRGRLESMSIVLPWQDREQIREILVA